MKLFNAAMLLTAPLFACTPPSTAADGGPTMTGGHVDLTAAITTDTTWTKDNIYVLKNVVHVDGATLTIEAGTTVLGDRGSALIVTRTAKLMAEGTPTAPIVFTANFPVGMRGVGPNNWGGIMLNGKAAVNVPGGDNKAEGLPDEPRSRYGGGLTPDPTHDCGTLKYVRIEFAGQPLSANDELNGLTLNACGSATVIDYLQVHRGIDDGLEIFGGSVNVKHVLLTGSDDDGLDWDLGWTGRAQFLIVQQLPERGNHGIEADSNRAAHDALPRSAPQVYNATLIGRAPDATDPGEGRSRGIALRVGTAGVIANSIVTNFTDWAVFVDGSASQGQWASSGLAIKHSIFFNNPSVPWQNTKPSALADGGMPADAFDEAQSLSASSLANRDADPLLDAPQATTAPSFKPAAMSPALSGGAVPPADTGFFDTAATFVGAIGDADWTQGWAAYPES